MRAARDRKVADDQGRPTGERDGVARGYSVNFVLNRAPRRIASDGSGESERIAIGGGTGAGDPADCGDARCGPAGDVEDPGSGKRSVGVRGARGGPGTGDFSGRAEVERANGLSAGEIEVHRAGSR